MRPGPFRAEQLPLFENAAQLQGDSGGRVNDGGRSTHNFLDERLNEGVMRTAKHESIGSFGQHRFQNVAKKGFQLKPIQLSGFNALHQAGAGIFQEFNIFGKAVHEAGVSLAFKSTGSSQYPHFPGSGSAGARLDRWFHPDERNIRPTLPQVIEGCGGCRITGHHDGFTALLEEELGDTATVGSDGFCRLRAVRKVYGITKIEEPLLWELLDNGIGGCLAAYARIE